MRGMIQAWGMNGKSHARIHTSETARSTSLILLYGNTFLHTHAGTHAKLRLYCRPWQTSILLSLTDVTELFTGNSSDSVTTIQMKDQQQTAELSSEVFGYPLVPERPQMQAVLSWKSSFLSNRASSVTNRRPPLTKWEPAWQMSLASLALSLSPHLHPRLRWHLLTSVRIKVVYRFSGLYQEHVVRGHERNSTVH